MRVSFISIDDENNKINFNSECEKQNHAIKFLDKSTTNTYIEVEVVGECVRLTRSGDVTMYMLFDISNITNGSYENQEGLNFDFEIKTTKLEVSKTKIRIDYSMIIEKETLSTHKLSLLFD